MNKKIVFFSIATSILILIGCLKTAPKDSFVINKFYHTDDEYKSANMGVYAILAQEGMYGRILSMDFDWGSDEMVSYRTFASNDLLHYNYTSLDPSVATTWTLLYNGIGRANTFLDNVANLSDMFRHYEAEVRFLRGYFYFLLAQHWGNVPIRDHAITSVGTTTNIHFQPVDSVYLFALNDMLTAYPNLLAKTDAKATPGRVNKMVGAGILARVYLHMAGYCYDQNNPGYANKVKGKYFEAQLKNTTAQGFFKQAKDWTDTIILKNYYNIASISYDSIFIAEAQDASFNSDEIIWEVEFYGNRTGAYADYYTSGRIGVINGIYGFSGSGYGFVTPYAVNYYDTTLDKRYKRNVPRFTYNTNIFPSTVHNPPGAINAGGCSLGKWRREDEKILPLDKNQTPTNFPLLRYADVLLMHAEAVNELALQYGEMANTATTVSSELTAIRTRAGLSYASSIPTLGTYALQDTIRKERMRELLGEGLRRQDLIRWGIYFQNIQTTISLFNSPPYSTGTSGNMNFVYGQQILQNIVNNNIPQYKFLVKPIPQQELNLNKASTAVQHPLWQ